MKLRPRMIETTRVAAAKVRSAQLLGKALLPASTGLAQNAVLSARAMSAAQLQHKTMVNGSLDPAGRKHLSHISERDARRNSRS